MPAFSTSDDTATPPVDEGLLLGARTRGILQGFILTLVITSTVIVVHGLWVYGKDVALLGPVAGIAVSVIGYYWIAHGKIKRAVTVMVWGVFLVVTALSFLVAGIRTPALMFVPSLCVLAAWLISIRASVVMGLIFTLLIVGFLVAERFGYVLPMVYRTNANFAMVLVPSVFLALLATTGAIHHLRGQIARVTELTRAQKAQLEALRLSEERFSALFKANPTPCSTVDDEGRTKDVNDAWVSLFGIPQEAARGRTTEELGLWSNPDDRASVLAEYAAKGQVSGMSVQFNTAKGQRHFLLYIAPVAFAGHQRLITSLVDQTDRLAAEAAQRAVTEELEVRVAQRTSELQQTVARLTAAQEELVHSEKLASLGAMVAGISHELNTPIGNTVTVSSTLHAQVQDFRKRVDAGQLRKSDLTEFLDLLEEMSDVVLRSTQRASELVTSFKQVAVDRSSERRRAFDVQTLVQELVTALKPGMRNYAVEIQVDIPPGITCDSFPGPVGQVITNLIQNALHHAFGESESGTIAIEAHQEGERVVMHVRDNGKGMDEHTLKHAFDPFFTTRLGQGGSGLGLSVSHRIATSVLGGTLSATSTPGSGSHFVFSFLRNPA